MVSLSPMLGLDGIQAREPRELYTTPRGLDLDSVEFAFLGKNNEFYDHLYDRALERFRQAGVHLKTNTFKPGDILLLLTINPAPLEGCEDKYLYTLRLEIGEMVVTERTPQQRNWSITYELGEPPSVVDGARVALGNLEQDLDELIDDFLVEYEHANSNKTYPRPLAPKPLP